MDTKKYNPNEDHLLIKINININQKNIINQNKNNYL